MTAGASAPETLVDEVLDALAQRFLITVEQVTTANERIAFKKVTFKHVRREFNTEADAQVNKALDRQLKK